MNTPRRPLLIVEDDPALQKQMQWAFDKYERSSPNDRDTAIAQLRRFEPAS
jgi:two-component system NtrC family response regulator